MYNFILQKLNYLLRNYYYDNYFNNNNSIKNFQTNIFKLEYFLYLKFYFIYLFFYNFKRNNFINYSLYLNVQHIIGELCTTNIKFYDINPINNITFLEKVSIYFFDYLLFNQIYFNNNIKSTNKFFLIFNIFLFQMGIIIHKLFKKRLHCIKTKKELNDNFDFLFLIHGLEDIDNVIQKTKFMNYSNFYFFINVLLFIFC